MHPLLSREEIDALLNQSGEITSPLPCQLNIELGKHCLVLKGEFNLDLGSTIELNASIGRTYEIRSEGRVVAYGLLVIRDEKIMLQITHLIDRNHHEAME